MAKGGGLMEQSDPMAQGGGAYLVGQVVEHAEHLRRHLADRHLEPQHKLVGLVALLLLLNVAVLLHVGAVVFQNVN